MQSQHLLAPHELLELHELMRSELVCARKVQLSMPLVQDEDLKSFMQDSLITKKANINQLEQLYIKAEHHRLL